MGIPNPLKKTCAPFVLSCCYLLCILKVGQGRRRGKRRADTQHGQRRVKRDEFSGCSVPSPFQPLSSEEIYVMPFLPLAPTSATKMRYWNCNASYILRKIIVNCAALTFSGFLLFDSLAAAIPRVRSGNLWGCSAAGANPATEY